MVSSASKRGRRSGGPPFVQLYRIVKRSQAWHDLSLPARCALIELLDRYNGINNGMIGLGVRTLADELQCSHATASRALKELDDAGLARPQTVGVWRGKRATEWWVTFYRCDASGELPNKSWPARSQSHHENAKVSPRKRNDALSLTSKTQTPKNPISENALSFIGEAHIDSNHGVGDLVARLSGPEGERRGEPYPDLPEFLKRG